jgi:hypothetical protein
MRNIEFRSFPFRSFLKEKRVGTGGIREILMSGLPYSVHSHNTGNDRERPGTGGINGGACND